MGKAKAVSADKQESIARMLNDGVIQKDIARYIGVSDSVVSSIKRKLRDNKPLKPSYSHVNSKRKTTKRDDKVIIKISTQNRKLPRRMICNKLQEQGITISKKTLTRRLHEENYYYRRATKKPLLTQRMADQRLEFAEQHKDWTQRHWNQVSISFCS